MKRPLLLFFLIIQSCMVYAQVDYSFGTSMGTYAPLSGAATATLTAANPGGRSLLDEAFANNIPIGFGFQYNGLNCSIIHLNANGFASLGAPFLPSPTDPTYDANELRAATGYRGAARPVLAPFWDNLVFTNATDLTYKTEGSAPNRVFTAQWQNMAWQSGTAALSFQLKLYETTNIIEFVYRQEGSTGVGAKSASIGITAQAGAQLIDDEAGNFLSLNSAGGTPTSSTLVETETIADRPATGQVYRFIPATCAPPAGLVFTTYGLTSASVQWTARAGTGSYEYGINNIEVPPANRLTTSGTTSAFTGLSPNQNYYVYVRSQCGSAWRVVSFKTTSAATVPYSEGFEAALDNALPRAMRRENLSNTFGDSYWQTTDLVTAATGSKAAVVAAPFVAGQSWLYTPGLSLVGGTTYKVSLKYASTAGMQGLELRWGTGVGSAAMTNLLLNVPAITGTAYQQNSASFVAPATDTYYVGFLCKSAVNNGLLTLDDLSITVDSSPVVAVTSVSVSPASASLLVGETTQLTATVAPNNATNKNVSWISGNTAVATVDGTGKVTAIAAGNAVITVTTTDGNKTASSTITVTAPITGTGTSTMALATWDFAGKGGQNNLSASTKAADISSAVAKLGPGLSVINYLSNGLTGTEQTATNLAGALLGNDYISFTVSPVAGKNLTLTKVDIRPVSQNRTRSFAVFSSVGGFASGQQLATFTGTNDQGGSLQSVTVSNHASLTATVEFRVYVYGGTDVYESAGIGNRNGAARAYDLAIIGTSAAATTPPAVATGKIIREYWSNIPGNGTSLIPLTQPVSGTAELTSLEGPTNWSDNYGTRIRGYVIPSTTGSYTLYAAGDDNVDLFLSSNDNPANKTRIAYVSNWTDSRQWTKETNQKSATINLVAGQKYYVEILHKEGGGGDNLAVGWTGPGISAITVIGGANIAPYVVSGAPRLAVSEAEHSIRIYPNPVGESFIISGLAQPSTVDVVSPDGRMMQRHEQVENQSRIGTGELQTGLYLIRVVNPVQGVVIQKIIKQ
ncbi:Ig-like domain-containing protein [Fibrella aquatilis]|uniref:Ig-like domain-containing protein n=1 Tax=Fibrella aquatilis TaxID=2817059 RepID=A0A939GBX8_9BACT|nr:Ig-like domain-containing protein [Fibrella aquatilis]MBO0933861.1 Ig-like domain-containing protein [Fibrella aquatilis]